MSYIGNLTQSIPFITDTFSGNASTTNFTLTRAPASTASIAVFISGLYQPPTTYSLIADVISFVSAPANGTNNLVILHIGNGSATQVPSDGSVTTPRIATGAVTADKIAPGVLPTATSNAAFAAANSAGSYANSGFAIANSAFSAANSTGSYANSAFITANAAFLQANTPDSTANSAAIYANGAFIAANTKTANTSINTWTANQTFTVANVTNQLEVYGRAFQNIITLTDASTITMNLAQTNNFSVTLGGNRILANVANSTPGQSGFLVVRQDGTGSRTLSFGSGWRFPSNSAPTLTTTANAVDLIVYTATTTSNVIAQALLSVT
jgi:hypothetical protein